MADQVIGMSSRRLGVRQGILEERQPVGWQGHDLRTRDSAPRAADVLVAGFALARVLDVDPDGGRRVPLRSCEGADEKSRRALHLRCRARQRGGGIHVGDEVRQAHREKERARRDARHVDALRVPGDEVADVVTPGSGKTSLGLFENGRCTLHGSSFEDESW